MVVVVVGGVVVVVSAALIVMVNALETLPPTLSVALKVTEEVPAVVGVPLTNPLTALSDRPAGKLPEVIDQV